MTETPIVHRSRCGCVHDQDGHCLMVCSTHTEAVEGRVGVRLRTLNGELAFFALAPEEARPVSPEESLCGEEELRSLGYTDREISEAQNVTEEASFARITGHIPGFDGWQRWGRDMGKNSRRQVLRALGIVERSLGGVGAAMLKEASTMFTQSGAPPLTERERLLITGVVRSLQHSVRECARALEGQ